MVTKPEQKDTITNTYSNNFLPEVQHGQRLSLSLPINPTWDDNYLNTLLTMNDLIQPNNDVIHKKPMEQKPKQTQPTVTTTTIKDNNVVDDDVDNDDDLKELFKMNMDLNMFKDDLNLF